MPYCTCLPRHISTRATWSR